MKTFLRCALIVGLLCLPIAAVAGMFDDVTKIGGGSSSGPSVDLNALSTRGTGVIGKVSAATVALGESLINIHTACGNKQSAEKLQASISNLTASKADPEKLKASVEEVNKAANEINQIDLQSKMNADQAKKYLGKSMLNLSAASLLDLSAVNDSKQLLSDSQSALTAVQAKPMQYGAGAVGTLKGVIDTSSFVANNIPTQVKSIQGVTAKLIDYAKTNKIATPSKKEIEVASKDLAKE